MSNWEELGNEECVDTHVLVKFRCNKRKETNVSFCCCVDGDDIIITCILRESAWYSCCCPIEYFKDPYICISVKDAQYILQLCYWYFKKHSKIQILQMHSNDVAISRDVFFELTSKSLTHSFEHLK